MSAITVTETKSTVSVLTSENLVTVQKSATPSLVTAVTIGPQGPAGATGGTGLGGYPVNLSNPAAGDILAFSGNDWFNNPQALLTDGGNF